MSDEIDYIPEDKCPSCFEGKIYLDKKDFVSDLPEGRQVIVKALRARVCDKCGETIFEDEEIKQIEIAVVRASGSLSPIEVKSFVEMTGRSESELSEKLGLGAKTIYRWRSGAQRPSKSLSILLALVAHNPKLLDWISREGWRNNVLQPDERVCPELDAFWGRARLGERFPHSRGKTVVAEFERNEMSVKPRFVPTLGLCTAVVE